jgi:hypothetical protein
VAAPAEPQTSSARAWVACGLIVLAAVMLVVGLLMLDSEAKRSLAWVVGPAAVLVAAAAALGATR